MSALGVAVGLLQYALQLRAHGECAPGGNETWREFDARCEAFLRSPIPAACAECERLAGEVDRLRSALARRPTFRPLGGKS